MGKYKAARKKTDAPVAPQMRPGAPCLVLIVLVMFGVCLVMYLVMRNAG